jgi:protein involved in polysaccharide export with SLBB domain
MILNLTIAEEVESDAREIEGKAAIADDDLITPAASHAGDVVDIEKSKKVTETEV